VQFKRKAQVWQFTVGAATPFALDAKRPRVNV
jgi:hypothetical protein